MIVNLCKANLSDDISVRDCVGHPTLCLPGLQLSVFIFLRAVVTLLGLLSELLAVLGFIICVSSALGVCWPVGSLWLRIRAGPEHTHMHACAHTQTHTQNRDVILILRFETTLKRGFMVRKGNRFHPIGCGRLLLGFGNLTGTA